MADGQDGSEDPTAPTGAAEEFPGVDDGTWRYWLEKNIIMWVAKDPYGFLYTVFLCLTPLFIISAILSYILMKDIDKKEKDKKRKAKRDANMARARGRTSKKTD
ncbi:small integral membrane protein 15-like [Asterias amurensis]|uniref:small integral membrane protein 15-like n=1 Tax=Asterias amurensis TaxID=7602 RepID=UPI003AB1EDE5